MPCLLCGQDVKLLDRLVLGHHRDADLDPYVPDALDKGL